MHVHPRIETLPPVEHFTYVMLWHICDHEGRLLDNLREIDAFVHHGRSLSCASELERLAELGLIQRYTAATGHRLIQIIDHARWFKISPSKFVRSKYPPPQGYSPPDHEETVHGKRPSTETEQ